MELDTQFTQANTRMAAHRARAGVSCVAGAANVGCREKDTQGLTSEEEEQ